MLKKAQGNNKAKIFILNGNATCGKDTFADIVGKYTKTFHYSIVSPIKNLIQDSSDVTGVNFQNKNEKLRKLISDIKLAYEEYNDLPYRKTVETIESIKDKYDCIFVDMREKSDIERLRANYEVKILLIENTRAPRITTNVADANIYKCPYDLIIENNGTLEDLERTAKEFVELFF